MTTEFPIFPVETIFKPFVGKLNGAIKPVARSIELDYPLRLNGMSLDAAEIANENATSFPAGEICFSTNKFVHTTIEKNTNNQLVIDCNDNRKAIVRHAFLVMEKVLNIEPTYNISVNIDSSVLPHSGFGSSGAIMASVCTAFNELCGSPISNLDLIKYMANNYGEEVGDDEDKLKLVQCIGGSVGNGLAGGGIIIFAGDATPIMTQAYESEILIAMPRDFRPKTAKEMMELEEQNLNKFVSHGNKYAYEIAYNLIHEGMPKLRNGDISAICKLIYRHRFEMGSIENCSFVYPPIREIANKLKYLYDDKFCRLISLSSVGPAFFIILDENHHHEEICVAALQKYGMNILHTTINNQGYKVKYPERSSHETS